MSEIAAAQVTPQAAPAVNEAPPATAPAAEAAPAEVQASNDRTKALREKMARERESRQAELKLREREAKIQEAEELLQLVKKDPFKFIEKGGISPDEFAQAALNYKAPTETDKLSGELQAMKAKLEAQEKQAQVQQLAQQEKHARAYIDDFVSENAKEFPLTKAAGLSNFVFETIQDHYTRTGEALDEEVAASEVETWLRSIVEKLAPQRAAQPSDVKPTSNPGAITISNEHSAATPVRSAKKLSKEESLANVKNLIRFQE